MTLAAKPKQPRPKKCRVCTETYTPSKPLQVVCSPSCALLHAAKKRERERKALGQVRADFTIDYLKRLKRVFAEKARRLELRRAVA